jgi:hypothetical protein
LVASAVAHKTYDAAFARSPVALTLFGHAAMALGLFVTDGAIDSGLPVKSGIVLALIALAVVAWGSALRNVTSLVAGAPAAAVSFPQVEWLAWLVALGSGLLAFVRAPGSHVRGNLGPYHALAGAAVLLIASYAVDLFALVPLSRSFVVLRRALLFLLALLLGAWILRASPEPQIDLFPLHQQTAQALLAGKSIYEPGAVHVLDTHAYTSFIPTYVYLPLSAYLTTVAYFFTGDIRWANCVAQLAGGVFLWLVARASMTGREPSSRGSGTLTPGVWADLLAVSLVFHPRGLLVLEKAWVEPLALPFLGGFVLAAVVRRPVVASACLGLLCAVKQHLVLYLPFLALAPGVGLTGVAIAGGVCLATLAPELLRSPMNLYRGTFTSILGSPFRNDALGVPAALSYVGLRIPSWVGFASALLPLAWARRIPRELGPLLLGACVVFGLFYLLGRQAFCNYYYLLDATALFAAATLTARSGRSGPDRSPASRPP